MTITCPRIFLSLLLLTLFAPPMWGQEWEDEELQPTTACNCSCASIGGAGGFKRSEPSGDGSGVTKFIYGIPCTTDPGGPVDGCTDVEFTVTNCTGNSPITGFDLTLTDNRTCLNASGGLSVTDYNGQGGSMMGGSTMSFGLFPVTVAGCTTYSIKLNICPFAPATSCSMNTWALTFALTFKRADGTTCGPVPFRIAFDCDYNAPVAREPDQLRLGSIDLGGSVDLAQRGGN